MSAMQFQPNFEKIKERMLAFWEGELIDRVMFYIEAPRKGVKKREVPAPPTPEERATNIDYQIESQLAHLEATYYGADALPSIVASLGVTGFTQLLGAEVQYNEHTTWTRPVIDDWESAEADIRVDWQGERWKQLDKMMGSAAQAARGKCLVKIPALAHGLDGLADLRGMERLCEDLLDRPDTIHKAMRRMAALWAIVYETLWKTATALKAELTDMLPLWCPGRFGTLQCDAMVMINGTMFRKFALPDIAQCAGYLDRSMFHLDGKEATHHLDDLLALDALDSIQFQQGSAWGVKSEPIAPFIPMLRKIQNAGKGVYLSVFPDELEFVMRELSSKRLFIGTSAKTENEAREIEKLAAKWTHE